MTTILLPVVVGAIITAGILIKSHFEQVSARKDFAGDPVQRRLAGYLEKYVYSPQEEASYQALVNAVRSEFDVLGVSSRERLQQRLLHAADINHQHVKSGLQAKPTPAQTLGAAGAINRLSREL